MLCPRFFAIFAPAVAKVYIVSFRTHDDRPSKFIVVADNMKSAIKMAWEHGGADFQSRFDKSTGQAQEMKAGALRVLLFTVQFFTNSPLLGNLQIPSILDNVRMIRVDGASSYLSQHQKYVAAVEESTTGRKKRPL